MSADAIDPVTLVDPELRPVLELVLQLFPATDVEITEAGIQAFRARGRAMSKPPLNSPRVEERSLAVAGAPDVTVYAINAEPGASRPAILHIHGGGYLGGSAVASVADMQVLAGALDCAVVTVEYRLAPETPFPGALDDNYAALKWLHDNAAELGVDPGRIALMGESAGGGHAVMLATAARDRGEVAVCLQALTYPMLDDRTGSSRTPAAHVGTFLWRPALNVAGWTALLGQAAGGDGAPEGAVPARAASVAGLPPTFIAVGTLDLFVDEDIAYARRLVEAGVPTELLVLPGAFHGSDQAAPHASVSRRQRRALYNALARAFGRPEVDEAPPPAPLAFSLPTEA